MASLERVRELLGTLAVNFAGDVTAEKVKLWHAALAEVPDAALDAAGAHVIRTHRGDFIPPVAVVREAAGANRRLVDGDSLRREIEKLGAYSPVTGWVAPPVDRVRQELGEAAAEAYGLAGGARVFSPNETTREIAGRDFDRALRDAVQAGVPILPSGPVVPLLTEGAS